jgi:hypothetical protein
MSKNVFVDVSSIVSIAIDPAFNDGNVRIAFHNAPSVHVDPDTANEIAEAVVAYEDYTFNRHSLWWGQASHGVCEEEAK